MNNVNVHRVSGLALHSSSSLVWKFWGREKKRHINTCSGILLYKALLRSREGDTYLLKAEVAPCSKLIVDCLVELTTAIFFFVDFFAIVLAFRCSLRRLTQARRNLLHATMSHAKAYNAAFIPSEKTRVLQIGLTKPSLPVIAWQQRI